MKVFAVHAVYNFSGRPRLCTDHRELFHGRICPTQTREAFLDPGEEPGAPLLLMRSGHWKPDAFVPANFVVCEAARAKLAWVPHVEFRPVRFVKLFDFPYYAPGDFSFHDNTRYKKAVGDGHADRLFKRLPDVPELHRDFPSYYEMITKAYLNVASEYGGLKSVVVPMPEGSGGTKEIMLSKELMDDYPILSSYFILFSDKVYPLIAPHLDPDYFDIVEVEV